MAIIKKRPTRKPRSFKRCFDPYRALKVDEQHIVMNGEKAPISQCAFLRKKDIIETYPHPADPNSEVQVLSREAVGKLNPNNIDVIQFWQQAVNHFPINSIAGNICMSIEEIHINHTALIKTDMFKNFMKTLKPNDKVLEIGVGYGSLYKALLAEKKISKKNWNFLDVVNLIDFEHPNFYLGNGWDIPTKGGIPEKFDLIVSYNCFQHLSHDQRVSYFVDAFDRLKNGGSFHFGAFVFDDVDHSNIEFFNKIDEDGCPLTTFFGQHTKCMPFSDTVILLREIGFEVLNCCAYRNIGFFHCVKP